MIDTCAPMENAHSACLCICGRHVLSHVKTYVMGSAELIVCCSPLQARQQFRDRNLAAAADTLVAATAGTEAATAVADWVADARARAAADQAVAFLRAYATCAGAAVA